MWTLWLGTAIFFVILELLVSGLVSIWFVPGAIITSMLSIWVDDFILQLVVFLLSSLVFLFVCRKFFKTSPKDKLDDTDLKLLGKNATVKEPITPDKEGKVLIGDLYWRAVSSETFEQGETVVITAVSGNLLTVDKK